LKGVKGAKGAPGYEGLPGLQVNLDSFIFNSEAYSKFTNFYRNLVKIIDSIGIRVVKVSVEIAYKEVAVSQEYQVNLDCPEESEMSASAVSYT